MGAIILLAIFGLFSAFGTTGFAAEADTPQWSSVSEGKDLTIFRRSRAGSNLKEFKAVGTISVTPETVWHVLNDTEEMPHFMPYVKEAKIISQTGDEVVAYQRVAPPLVGERDYTLRVYREMLGTGTNPSFRNHWELANKLGPAEKKGVVRVKTNEGSWLLEPSPTGRGTVATYCIFCDSAGSIPAFIANRASIKAIRGIFEAVRAQSKLAKYATAPH